MCGIIGWYSSKRKLPAEQTLIKMRDKLSHRGPDDAGIFISEDGKCALANRRLAIIDLSKRGHQPMSNEDGTIWIVHNGEIYNFRELRKNLIDFKFKSDTDTEVVLYLYEKYGVDCLQYLQGMFAFIIFDKRKKRLFFARDHLGIKPLYYYQNNDILILASELKAMLDCWGIERKISPEGFLSYLYFGSVAEPYTIIRNIRMFPPANFGVFKNGKLKTGRYWKINNKKDFENGINKKEKLLDILKDSVRKRLISNVPLGAFLSGGVDSSAIVSLMKEVSDNGVKTFTLVFEDSDLSEGSFAKMIADKYATEHIERIVNPVEVRNEMGKVIESMDQPTVDGVNTYFVSKYAKESGIAVALSGLGGDELFGGYPSFRLIPKLLRISKNSFLKNLIKLSSFLFSERDKYEKLNSYFGLSPTLYSAYFAMRGVLTDKYIEELLNIKFYESIKNRFSPVDYIQSLQNLDEIGEDDITDIVSIYELRGYMRNQLLRDTDFMSMANSLEVRVPLIDKDLVEFVFSLLSQYRERKKFLIETMGEKLTKEIWNRPKQGFTFPFDKWLRGELKEWVKDSLPCANDEYFNGKGVERLWKDFLNKKIYWSRIWLIVVFNKWRKLKSVDW